MVSLSAHHRFQYNLYDKWLRTGDWTSTGRLWFASAFTPRRESGSIAMEINLRTEGGRARTVRKAKRAAQRTLRWMQAKVERTGPWAMLLVMLLLAPLACVLMLHRKHGSAMGTASRFRQLDLSAADTAAAMQAHTLLMLGGPHRGGTTLLWRLLGQHPNVSAFSRDPVQEALTPFLPGGRLAADVDVGMEMEGLYQQSVYPLFGLGSQVRSLAPPRPGLGFLPPHAASPAARRASLYTDMGPLTR
jgi:hypothetical protein